MLSEREHRGIPTPRATACFLAFAITTASVIDNPAVCREEPWTGIEVVGGASPVVPHDSCAGMPCQTPTEVLAPVSISPVFTPPRRIVSSAAEPVSAEAAPPPTPPPTGHA